MLRGILRAGSLGQHRILYGHTSQSGLLALYSIWSLFTILPVVVSVLNAGQMYTLRDLSKVKSSREKVPSSRLERSQTGMCGAICFSLTSQFRLAADP